MAVAAIAVVSLGVVPESIASSSPASPAKSGKGRKTVYKDKEAVYNESAFFKAGTGVVEGKFEGPKVPGFLEYYGYNAFGFDTTYSASSRSSFEEGYHLTSEMRSS